MIDKNTIVTLSSDIRSMKLYHIPLSLALSRIKHGRSKNTIANIRTEPDKDRKDSIKHTLPCVCFSGQFSERSDSKLIKHSSLVIIDFDHVDVKAVLEELSKYNFIYAKWVSPSGDGVKALVYIKHPEKHREHYLALMEVFPSLDKKNINESRVCFESYDPNIEINENATPFENIKEKVVVENKGTYTQKEEESSQILTNLLTWISSKGEAFVDGNRNNFIYKFASAACRFGVNKDECQSFCEYQFLTSSTTFSTKELEDVIKSSYRSNSSKFGTCAFERNVLVNKTDKVEVSVTEDLTEEYKPRDVIFGEDVLPDIIDIYRNGRPSAKGINVPQIDYYFKLMKKEITLLSGYSNQGKSSIMRWYFLMRAIIYKEKFGVYCPEDSPAEEYFISLIEMVLGTSITKDNKYRPSEESIKKATDFISKHFFFIEAKYSTPTPQYISERFLKLIMLYKIDGILIDPFNQLSHNYSSTGGRTDKYLEVFLADFSKFIKDNNVYGCIVAHPRNPEKKDSTGNYPCPDVYNIADGAMFANKCDDILIYHRPVYYSDPTSTLCELHSKKIRRQWKAKRGVCTMDYDFGKRRYMFDNTDYMERALIEQKINFDIEQNPSEYIRNDYRSLGNALESFDNSLINEKELDVPF